MPFAFNQLSSSIDYFKTFIESIYKLEDDNYLLIPQNRQLIVHQKLELDGGLDIEGELVII